MQVSENGLALIASFEGFSPVLYNDPIPHCTIGYGFLVHLGACDGRSSEAPYRFGMTVEQGRAMLREKVKTYANGVLQYTSVPINQNQFDALTSFCYNVGVGGYQRSNVRRVLNAGNYAGVCAALRQVVTGTNGVVYPGLIRRREAECQLFNSNSSHVHIPTIGAATDMFTRLNGRADFFDGKEWAPGEWEMNLGVDFPNLPPHAKLVELDIRVDFGLGDGYVEFRDGSGAFADVLNRGKSMSIIRVVPQQQKVKFAVAGQVQPIKFTNVGIVGYWT